MPPRQRSEHWTAKTQDERLVLLHFRQQPHDRLECPACGAQEAHYSAGFGAAQRLAQVDLQYHVPKAYAEGYAEAVRHVAEGR